MATEAVLDNVHLTFAIGHHNCFCFWVEKTTGLLGCICIACARLCPDLEFTLLIVTSQPLQPAGVLLCC